MVLVACEESQRVTISLRELGVEAFSCDILPCSGGHPEWHILGDVSFLLNGRTHFYTQNGDSYFLVERWSGIIAFPPCTYLTKASACRMYPVAGNVNSERYAKMVDAREFFLSLLRANCDFVCVENPRPLKLCYLPKPSQVVQPYMFGEPYSKETLLWLRGFPSLVPYTCKDDFYSVKPWVCSNTSSRSANAKGAAPRGCDALERSKTFWGVARAMASQWYKFLI